MVTKGSGAEGNAAKCIVMAAWELHGLCFGEEAGARKLVFFRVLQRVVVSVCVILCVS